MFDRQMPRQAMARWSTETELRRAIERDEFELHYQPIVDSATGSWRPGGAGALAAPDARAGAPDAFIPMAEETGLIVAARAAGAASACRQLRAWQRELPVAGRAGWA